MKTPNTCKYTRGFCLGAAIISFALQLMFVAVTMNPASAQETNPVGSFSWVNLQGDLAGIAYHQDPNLVAPWGLALNPFTNVFWVADNGTGVSTFYHADGTPAPLSGNLTSPLLNVVIPNAGGGSGQSPWPTGIVYNPSANAFLIGDVQQPATFLFVSSDGGLSAWNPDVNLSAAVLVVDNSGSGASYRALALATLQDGSLRLYATDFYNAKVDVFDSSFNPVTVPGGFTDPNLPAGYAPFGIAAINGQIYVTYAKQKLPAKVDFESGAGNGFVDVFDVDGNLQARLISQGALNAPFGLARVPSSFGQYGNQVLLVGNAGDGRINAFDTSSGIGTFIEPVHDAQGTPLAFDDLRSLLFYGERLYFTAALAHEHHGLFGYIYNTD